MRVERELLPMAEAFGLSVAAWSPLGGGVLSGKYARPGTEPARLAADSISEHDHTVAAAVAEVAAELGATPAQVAIAWTRRRSRAVHPILGARRLDQLVDNLGALDVDLPDEAAERLAAATGFQLGFPTDFVASIADRAFDATNLRLDPR